MEGVVSALKMQGLRVGNTQDERGNPAYYITDNEGIAYIVPLTALEELQEQGKLTLEGIKEHDEKVRRKALRRIPRS